MFVQEVALFPIIHIANKIAIGFNLEICNYTKSGRNLIHENLSNINSSMVYYLMKNPVFGESVEFNDNRISLYVAQKGKCFITGKALEISDMDVHHKIPQQRKGKDNYGNLVFVCSEAHKLIHATEQATIEKYIQILTKEAIDFKKLNQLRVSVGNLEI
jgi:RNA-directed DNA polymerase